MLSRISGDFWKHGKFSATAAAAVPIVVRVHRIRQLQPHTPHARGVCGDGPATATTLRVDQHRQISWKLDQGIATYACLQP